MGQTKEGNAKGKRRRMLRRTLWESSESNQQCGLIEAETPEEDLRTAATALKCRSRGIRARKAPAKFDATIQISRNTRGKTWMVYTQNSRNQISKKFEYP